MTGAHFLVASSTQYLEGKRQSLLAIADIITQVRDHLSGRAVFLDRESRVFDLESRVFDLTRDSDVVKGELEQAAAALRKAVDDLGNASGELIRIAERLKNIPEASVAPADALHMIADVSAEEAGGGGPTAGEAASS